jgi:hypothetical protein
LTEKIETVSATGSVFPMRKSTLFQGTFRECLFDRLYATLRERSESACEMPFSAREFTRRSTGNSTTTERAPRSARRSARGIVRAGRVNLPCFRVRLRGLPRAATVAHPTPESASTPVELDDEEPVAGSDDRGVVEVGRNDDRTEVRENDDETYGTDDPDVSKSGA